ncbi:ankyrin repeat and KH domain-containing protein mask-like [Haliotis rufescens]|uniref:ankyrin repeat and KH domain-containing protein mask-like n=1 Tax=Haliotis rufescens TaxID=6454 RepID=UPI001EAF9BF4|nr:ankyrin repeat and KH domain-containing protein mask-like [Haliotis rufescens]
MMCAVSEGRIKAMKLLLAKGADVSLVDDTGENILHEACLGGHVEIVEYVLSLEKVDIEQKGNYGRTPVMKAAEMGYREVLDVLVSKGGDTTAVDDKGNNILHVACIGGNVDMVKHVLAEDRINSKGQYGRTPVMMAACCRHRKVVEVLENKGADISIVDNDGNNILHMACIGGNVDVVKYVLTLDAVDINSKGQYGRTPARMADFRKHREVFDLLMGKGADLSQVDDQGDNILHMVCLEGHLELVKDIITNNRVDINSRGRYGRTPVMKAAEKGHKEVFIFLMINRSDVFLKDDHDNNILHMACLGGNLEMVQYIVSLCNMVEDINSRGQYGRTPLLMAAGGGHTDVGKFLVDKGADVSLVDDDSNNILHLACYRGHEQFVKFVISKNVVDILAVNKQGLTAKKIAKELGDQTVNNVLYSSLLK